LVQPGDHAAILALRDLGESADLFRQVVADRLGLTGADLAVLSLLEARGPLTAGQLAEASGLSTGAITGVADRLEGAGYARRGQDPDDRRRVIVALQADRLGPIVRLHEPLHAALHALDQGYDEGQRAMVSEYVRRAAAHFRAEALRLKGEVAAPPPGSDTVADGREASAPLGSVRAGRLEFTSGAARVVLRAGAPEGLLFQARFEGKPPRVTVRGGTVAVGYRGFGPFGWRKNGAAIDLSPAVPWEVALRGGVARLEADLTGLAVSGVEIRGGGHAMAISLPRPAGSVPVRFTGGASDLSLRRPAGTAARLRVTGGAAALQFDSQRLGAVGGTVVLESPGFAAAADRYDFELTGGAAGLTVTAG
jgi:DNA-binding MarR family transcriptional regulator